MRRKSFHSYKYKFMCWSVIVMNKNIPNSVCWNITNRCNDNCLFCYRDINTKEISFEKQKKIIDAISSTGIYKLTFVGGEPLLVKNIQQLILYAKDKGLNVSLTTNGIILNGELLEFCLKELDWLTLPMDSYYEKGQSKMSRNPNHFKKIYKILDFANDYSKRNCKIKINTVVSNINKEDIKYIAHIIDEKNINRWKLFQFVPLRDSAKENSKIFEIKSEDFYKSVDDAKKFWEIKINAYLYVIKKYRVWSFCNFSRWQYKNIK